jgi:hypothetical protein
MKRVSSMRTDSSSYLVGMTIFVWWGFVKWAASLPISQTLTFKQTVISKERTTEESLK